ncbi:MAG: GNAT family N-acetyltransferase [Pyrinomonadaceae bacterium]
MELRNAVPEDFEQIRELLAANGWEKRVADAERFRRMMENASRTVVAVDGKRIVGFARALCDDASNGYIGTVLVVDDKRGQGIGRQIVEQLIGDDPDITWVLRAGRESGGFWEKMGFNLSVVAMERPRR